MFDGGKVKQLTLILTNAAYPGPPEQVVATLIEQLLEGGSSHLRQRQKGGAAGRQGGRSTGSSMSWRSNSTCCAPTQLSPNAFSAATAIPTPAAATLTFPGSKPHSLRRRGFGVHLLRADKAPSYFRNPHAQLKGTSASPETGVPADSIIPPSRVFPGSSGPRGGRRLFGEGHVRQNHNRKPIFSDCPNDLKELLEIDRFDNVRTTAHVIHFKDLLFLLRSGQDNDWQAF
jgi:hypothetical protein